MTGMQAARGLASVLPLADDTDVIPTMPELQPFASVTFLIVAILVGGVALGMFLHFWVLPATDLDQTVVGLGLLLLVGAATIGGCAWVLLDHIGALLACTSACAPAGADSTGLIR